MLKPEVRAVAVPTEHGGWSLTLEPAILGLIVAFSPAGLALAAAALIGFVARTPLKVILVDRFRNRWLERTTLAARILAVEAVVGSLLVVLAVVYARGSFWWPLLISLPLIAIELWHDMRSRSRHLIPELAGSIGIAGIAAIVALAGGESSRTASGLWIVMAARVIGAVPFVRVQLLRFKERAYSIRPSDTFQVGAVAVVLVAWGVDLVPLGAVIAIAILALFEVAAVRIQPVRAAMVGAQQVVLGLTVVVIAALAFVAP
jgi:hypothetical protein